MNVANAVNTANLQKLILVSVMEWEVGYKNLVARFNDHKSDHSEVGRDFHQSVQISESL
jgi:hypothetical protein